ncbi:hypothetical protein [Actinoplanes utahensis]|uniref:Uncharacterized protein n=1 Tax=Actinoplanes utahensis TaxID=1869 RepID=A0A0A6UJ54_ACTUT|nr:hypothetical protein [Actinoplanes utahensis]KHD75113.1 hypothetical protein MB27_24635 [Actinoplanes utahensis]GIF27052.1 hypothetical protein Aut01nite_00380 [Actinoplanes utahensis]
MVRADPAFPFPFALDLVFLTRMLTSAANLDRRRRGLDVLAAIDGHAGTAVIDSLAEISPALGHHVAASS